MVKWVEAISILTLVLRVCTIFLYPFSVQAGLEDKKSLTEKLRLGKSTEDTPKKRVISRGYVPPHTTVLPKQYEGLPRDAFPVDESDRIFTYKQ